MAEGKIIPVSLLCEWRPAAPHWRRRRYSRVGGRRRWTRLLVSRGNEGGVLVG